MVLMPKISRAGWLVRVVPAAMLLMCGAPTLAAPPRGGPGTGAVARAARPAAAVVDAFHQALARGDTKVALSYLAENALIYESGGAERGKREYASHHLAADAAFSQAVPSKVIRRVGYVTGTTAWIASEGRTTGTFRDKPVDRRTAETMVLRRTGASWKIVHIHWSSTAAAGGQ